jgi:hypothetical protein
MFQVEFQQCERFTPTGSAAYHGGTPGRTISKPMLTKAYYCTIFRWSDIYLNYSGVILGVGMPLENKALRRDGFQN